MDLASCFGMQRSKKAKNVINFRIARFLTLYFSINIASTVSTIVILDSIKYKEKESEFVLFDFCTSNKILMIGRKYRKVQLLLFSCRYSYSQSSESLGLNSSNRFSIDNFLFGKKYCQNCLLYAQSIISF